MVTTPQQLLGPLALVAFLAAGCAKPPTEQVQATEQAVEDARQSGAATYTAEEYAKLEGMVAALKKELGDQDAKLLPFRDYGKAEQLAASAKADSEWVKVAALKKRRDAQTAALHAQYLAQEAVQSTLRLVARVTVGKDTAALEAVKTVAAALQASLNEVQLALDHEDYSAAQAQAQAIHEKSLAVTVHIQRAANRMR